MAKASPTRPAPKPPTPIKPVLRLVELKAPTTDTSALPTAQVPDKWTKAERAGAFNPAADWKTAGEYIDGEYLGFDDKRGPNQSRLYHLRFEDGTYVDVWGSTALDSRMDDALAHGMERGDDVFIQYLGTQPTKRGMNPVKVFDVRFIKSGA